jgi:hypothetical protein
MSSDRLDAVYRIVFAAGALWVGWWLGGPIGLVLVASLAGWLIAPVLYDGAAFGFRTARWLALHPLQGNYYAYRGNAIEVLEDDEGFRWLRVSDVRRTLRDLPKDATLQHIEPERTEFDEAGKRLAMRSDALLQWVGKAHTAENIRFKVWVERAIHNPSLAVRREVEKKAIRQPVV